MDENNISNLKGKAPKNAKAKILLLGDFDPQGERIIRDPYYVSVNILGTKNILFYHFWHFFL